MVWIAVVCVKNGKSVPWSWGSSSGVLVGCSFMSGGDVDDFNCHSWCEGFVWQLSFLVMVDFGFCTCLLMRRTWWRILDKFELWSDLYDWSAGNVFLPRVWLMLSELVGLEFFDGFIGLRDVCWGNQLHSHIGWFGFSGLQVLGWKEPGFLKAKTEAGRQQNFRGCWQNHLLQCKSIALSWSA